MRSPQRRLAALPALLGAAAVTSVAPAAQCSLGKFAEFPITMDGSRPLTTAQINGTDVQFIVDSGAFYSMMSSASAAQLNLRQKPAPFGFALQGVRGRAEVSIASAKTFALAGATLHNVEFLVGGSEVGEGSVGLLGQNFLHIGDVEYDLGAGVIRLMKVKDCRKASLAYWVDPAKAYSVVDLESQANAGSPFTLISAYVNGTRIRVMFDSGAAGSVLSLTAAARVGIRPDSPGVVKEGMSTGIGKALIANYLAPVENFKIGNEEIRHTRIRIGDIDLPDADMLIGADFFMSHRIYVANSQQKVYFTYSGGPVFNLSTKTHAADTSAPDASAPGTSGSSAASETAAESARRAAALASRQEFEQALTAFDRACELAPDNADYVYARGRLHLQLKQTDAARADFDRAITLKRDDVPALVARAGLAADRGDKAAAATDLDAADGAAPKQADVRFEMAAAYERAGRMASAISQLTLWLDSHGEDARTPMALSSRCRFRALAGTDLPLALKDCRGALSGADRASALYARTLDGRGLIYLRMKVYDQAIADFSASLRVQPKNYLALYGRGISELHIGKPSAGNADVADALAIHPAIADDFRQRGLAP